MIKTSWIDPDDGREFSYNWGYDFSGEKERRPCPRNRFIEKLFKNDNEVEYDCKENTMRITNDKKANFDNMLRKFAANHGLEVETRCDSLKYDYHYVTFKKRDATCTKHKEYVIRWDLVEDPLHKCASKIFDELTRMWDLNAKGTCTLPGMKNVIFNNPVTIVLWNDGTKTIVRCTNEEYDPEKGLAMAISKKVLGNKGNYFDTFKKWIPEKLWAEAAAENV